MAATISPYVSKMTQVARQALDLGAQANHLDWGIAGLGVYR